MKTTRQGFVLCRRWNHLSSRSYHASSTVNNIRIRRVRAPQQPLLSPKSSSSKSTSRQNKNNRWQSTCPLPTCDIDDDSQAPVGDLFQFPDVGFDDNIVGMTGSIRRSFGPQSSAEAMITCGGEALAAHASFDPDYGSAQEWIRSHPVGPAVLSPVLISGLVGALVEAAFPKAVAVSSSMQYLRPLIVGVEVRAKIEVVSICSRTGSGAHDDEDDDEAMATGNNNNNNDNDNNAGRERTNGHKVNLRTGVFRINDETLIAEGTHSIWIPDYLRM